MSIQPDFGASTYDSVHGWVMGGRTVEYDDVYDREYLVEKTKDGSSFEPFPSLPDDFTTYGFTCLEALNNGGDIFVTGSGRNTTYIFRTNTSTWERQPDVPREYSEGMLTQLQTKSHIFISPVFQQFEGADL